MRISQSQCRVRESCSFGVSTVSCPEFKENVVPLVHKNKMDFHLFWSMSAMTILTAINVRYLYQFEDGKVNFGEASKASYTTVTNML